METARHAAETHEETIARYFEGVAATHTQGYNMSTRSGYVYVQRRQLVREALARFDGGDILDVGCATGTMREPSKEAGFHYHGIDRAEEMIREARRIHGEVGSFSVGRVEQIASPDEQYDLVLALGVLEYVHPDRLETAVSELARVLRPNGHLIVSLLNRASPVWAARAWRDAARRSIARRRGSAFVSSAPELTYSRSDVDRLIRTAGLHQVHSEMYGCVPIPARLYALDPDHLSRLCLQLERWRHTKLGRLALAHFVIATKPT